MKEKIIFFLSPDVTGAERVTITLAKGLDKEKYDVSYGVIGNTFGEIVSYIPGEASRQLVSISQLDDFLKFEHPDTVFCSLIHLNGKVLKSARRVGDIKVVLRNNYNLKDVSEDNLRIAKYCYPKADIVIAQTEVMKQELMTVCGVTETNIRVIDNPLDTEFIENQIKGTQSPYPADGKTHLCWVGRYDPIKGVDLMLEAFNMVYKVSSMYSLYLVGKVEEDNSYFRKMASFIQENNLNDAIHILGFQANPYGWLAYADALLIPSRSEANSNVFKEATHLGTPVIFNNHVKEMAQLILQTKKKKLMAEEKKYYVHPSSYVDDGVEIGENTKIWHFSHVQKGARLGANCSLGQNVNIGNNVHIGNGVRIQNNVSVYEGVEIEDNVFCGPSCVFTNVTTPRAHFPVHGVYAKTLIKEGASLGANCTVVCGHTVGKSALIGSGAVVAKDVKDYALMVGVPARQIGWVCECGKRLGETLKCDCGRSYHIESGDVLVKD